MYPPLAKVEYPVLRSAPFQAKPSDLIRAAKKLQLEGYIAKRKGSLYEPGRRSGFIAPKVTLRQLANGSGVHRFDEGGTQSWQFGEFVCEHHEGIRLAGTNWHLKCGKLGVNVARLSPNWDDEISKSGRISLP